MHDAIKYLQVRVLCLPVPLPIKAAVRVPSHCSPLRAVMAKLRLASPLSGRGMGNDSMHYIVWSPSNPSFGTALGQAHAASCAPGMQVTAIAHTEIQWAPCNPLLAAVHLAEEVFCWAAGGSSGAILAGSLPMCTCCASTQASWVRWGIYTSQQLNLVIPQQAPASRWA